MSYTFKTFSSVDEANTYFADHPDFRPIAMMPGETQNIAVVLYEDLSQSAPPKLSGTWQQT